MDPNKTNTEIRKDSRCLPKEKGLLKRSIANGASGGYQTYRQLFGTIPKAFFLSLLAGLVCDNFLPLQPELAAQPKVIEARPSFRPSGKPSSKHKASQKKIYTLRRGESIKPGEFQVSVEASGKSAIFLVQQGRRQVSAIWKNKRLGPYLDAYFPSFDLKGGNWGFLARTRSQQVLAVVNGQEFGPYKDVAPMRFSRDGKRWGFEAFLANARYAIVAVVDGQSYGPYESLGFNTLRFSPEGRHWGLRSSGSGRNFVVVDGRSTAPTKALRRRFLAPMASIGDSRPEVEAKTSLCSRDALWAPIWIFRAHLPSPFRQEAASLAMEPRSKMGDGI